ncbi:hypothetical protein Tco_0674756 [Tanacetum coccineum]
MSTPVFVDPKSSTQADGAQNSRVPVPLPEDPYKAIRQAYLDGTDTESEPFENPTDTETPESPLAIAPPVLVPILRRTTRMVVRVPHAMSCGLSAGMAKVAAMSEFALRKRFRSSCESSPSVSPPDLPLRKRYSGTSELVEGSEEDYDEEIEESMDSDSVSEDAEDEGPIAEDEDPTAEDKGLTTGVEVPRMDDEDYDLDNKTHGRDDEGRGIDDEGHSVESDGLGLEEEEEVVPRGQRQAALVVRTTPILTTWTDPEDGMIYIDIPDYPPPAPPVQTPPLPEWTSGSLPISPSHFDVPSPISSPMIPLTVPSPVATPAMVKTEGFLTEYDKDIGELFTRSGAVREDIFSQRYRFKSLEYEQERVAVTFGAIWRPDLRLQLAEERRARLELAEVVDGMRRRKEPRGGV